ncbi:hypothetical protein [Amycolatopsis sp. lyj-90]|uniref:hypothetical protein n=1 Tax=Amycolatopsis sp. lyj-90 TaxID=2789285 RepID=UPI00397824FF
MNDIWSDIEECGNVAGAPPMPPGAVVPGLELAAWLDRYVDSLLDMGVKVDDLSLREQRVDLMVALSSAAEAFRAAYRCDHASAERQLRSALALLSGVDLDIFVHSGS